MKIAVVFLLVAISCCFHSAASNCVKRCSSGCRQGQLNDIACLQKSLMRNLPDTVNAMANVLCVYDNFKASKNRMVIVKAIRDLQEISGCRLENLLGSSITMDDLSGDVNGVLQFLLKAIYDVMIPLNIDDYNIPRCGPAKPLFTKISKILFLYGVPSLNEQIPSTVGINKVSRLLAIIQTHFPELFHTLLEMLIGPGPLIRELALSLDGLTVVVTKTVGDLGKTLARTTGRVTETGGLLKNIGGTSGTVPASNGLLGEVTQLLPPVLRVVNGVVGTVGSTLEGVTNLLDGTKGGLLGNVANIVPDALGGVLGGSGLTNGVLGTLGLGGSNGGSNGLIGSVSSLAPNLLGGVLGGGGSTNGLGTITGVLPNILGASGGNGLASIQAGGSLSGKLGESVGISAGGNLGIGLGSSLSNTVNPGETIVENREVSRPRETPANGLFGGLFRK